MTTLSISSAFRHIAAAFGSERAQQKLAQQKEDRAAIRLLSHRPIDRERMYAVPAISPVLSGRTRTTPQDVKNLLAPVSIQLQTKGSTPPQPGVAERSRDTPERRPRSALTHETTRAAASPSHVAARSASTNRISTKSAQQGGWLHNHWKPSAAGAAARAGHVDTPDAKASAAKAAPATATAREEARTVATFSGPAWMLRSTFIATPFRIPRPAMAAKAASTAAASAPAGKPTLPARTDKVLEHKEVIRASMRPQARAIRFLPRAVMAATAHTVTTPAQPKASPLVIAQPAMPTTKTKTMSAPTPAPPPPPLPQDVSPKRVVTASGGVFAELKSRTLATSKSLDDSATETFGTGTERTGDAAKRASLDVGRHSVNPAKAAAQSLQSELALAMERRRKQLGEKPAKTRVASEGPVAIRPQPNAAAKADTLIKPRPVALVPQLISKEQKANVFEELQRTLAARVPQRAM